MHILFMRISPETNIYVNKINFFYFIKFIIIYINFPVINILIGKVYLLRVTLLN